MHNGLTTAVLGGGCFWCTEAVFQQVKGVHSVTPGYAGGNKPNPTYEEVTSGLTGHAEVVKIEFDPGLINFQQLLDIFWISHDPTTPNRQGNDIGSQYRSIILYDSLDQKRQATASKHRLEKSGVWPSTIVTEIKALDKFYSAENYHRNYFRSHPEQAYCQLVIAPKLKKLQSYYANKR